MNCHDCGKQMLPDVFARNLDGFLILSGHSGYDAGKVVNGEVWLRCPNGHRGAWVKVEEQHD